MNFTLSATLSLLFLVLWCTCTSLNILYKINEKTTIIPHQVTEIIPIPATTSEIPTNFQSNHTDIAVLVVRKSLRFSSSDICGGILVSARIVITAAHCVYDPHGFYRKYPYMFRVAYGRLGVYKNVGMKGPSAELVVAHPNYNENQRIDDIGAIRLKEGYVMIAGQLVPTEQDWSELTQLEMLVFSVENEVLQIVTTERLDARRVSKYRCEVAYHRWGIHISSKQLCIEVVDPDFYHRGESAILLLNGHPIGVLSFKFDVSSRANSLPYIYTDLSRYSEFIRKEIHAAAALSFKPYRICSSILYVVISMTVFK